MVMDQVCSFLIGKAPYEIIKVLGLESHRCRLAMNMECVIRPSLSAEYGFNLLGSKFNRENKVQFYSSTSIPTKVKSSE